MLQMPDGHRVVRSFSPTSATVGHVQDWADVEGLDLPTSRLVLNRPRRVLLYPEDSDKTLSEAGLVGPLLLFVEPR